MTPSSTTSARPHAGGDDGHADGHRLAEHGAEGLLVGRGHEHVEVAHEPGGVVVPGDVHGLRRGADLARYCGYRRAESSPTTTTRAPGAPARIAGAATSRSTTPLRGSMRPTKPMTGPSPGGQGRRRAAGRARPGSRRRGRRGRRGDRRRPGSRRARRGPGPSGAGRGRPCRGRAAPSARRAGRAAAGPPRWSSGRRRRSAGRGAAHAATSRRRGRPRPGPRRRRPGAARGSRSRRWAPRAGWSA